MRDLSCSSHGGATLAGEHRRVSMLLKALIALGVALPLAAFVAGSLVSATDQPSPRERIIIPVDSTPTGPAIPEPGREQDPGRKPPADDADDRGEGGDDDGAGAHDTDDGGRAPGGGGDADDVDERDDEGNAGDVGGGVDDDTDNDDSEKDDD